MSRLSRAQRLKQSHPTALQDYFEIDKISIKPRTFVSKGIDLRYIFVTNFGDPGVEQERETRPLVMTSLGPLETTVMWPRAAASPELVSSWVRHEAEEPQNVWGGSIMTSDHSQSSLVS